MYSSLWEGRGEQDSSPGNRHSGESQTVILGKHLSSWGCLHHRLPSCFPQLILLTWRRARWDCGAPGCSDRGCPTQGAYCVHQQLWPLPPK